MNTINEQNQFDATVPALQDNIDDLKAAHLNAAPQALANRTKFLKGLVDGISATLSQLKAAAFLAVGTVTGTVAAGDHGHTNGANIGGPYSTTNHGHNDATALVSGFMPAAMVATLAANNLAANGFQKFPNGLILQWGSYTGATSSEGEYDTTFPIPFPTECLCAVATDRNPSGATAGGSHAEIKSFNTTTLAVFIQSDAPGNTATGYCWFAVGH